MNKLSIFFLSMALLGSYSVSAQTVNWAYGFLETNNSLCDSRAAATDEFGNVYTTGRFFGLVVFDSSTGTVLLESETDNQGDIFVLKYNSNGDLIWAKSFGGSGDDYGNDIVVGGNGYVYITGVYSDVVDFHPNEIGGTLQGSSQGSPFMLTLDQNGDYIDVVGASNQGIGEAVIYRSQSQQAVAIYNFSDGTYNGYRLLGVSSVFLVRTSSANTLVAYDFELAPNNNDIVVTGKFSGTVDFDPAFGGSTLTATGNNDVFVCKYTLFGSVPDLVWGKKVGGSQFETGYAIGVDEDGYIYVAGTFNGTPDFDPGAGIQNVTTIGGNDVFVLKLISNGNFGWVKTFGTISSESVWDIYVGATNFYLTGSFSSTMDFDPGTSVFNLTPYASSDVYVAKFVNVGGYFDSAFQVGGNSSETGNAIAVNSAGNLFLTGNSNSETVDFDPSNSVYNVNSIGPGLSFVAKYCLALQSSVSVSSCDAYTDANGLVYTNSGNYTVNYISYTGCDSIVELNLTITQSTASTIDVEVCDSYVAPNGQTYVSSGVYNAIIPNSLGCDSTITINLSVNNTESTVSTVSCEPYVAANGQVFSASGLYSVTIDNSAGCDSIITIDLTVVSVDTSISQFPGEVLVNQSGAAYQWLDCSTGFSIIAGEQNQSFSPIVNGTYSVEVNFQGCIDTSQCIGVYDVGVLDDVGTNEKWLVYPIPTSGVVHIELPFLIDEAVIEVFDMVGTKAWQTNLNGQQNLNIDLSSLPNGVYLMSLLTNDSRFSKKLVIQE